MKNIKIILWYIFAILIPILIIYYYFENYTNIHPDFKEARILYWIRFLWWIILIIFNTIFLSLNIKKDNILKFLYILITSTIIWIFTIDIWFMKIWILAIIHVIIISNIFKLPKK